MTEIWVACIQEVQENEFGIDDEIMVCSCFNCWKKENNLPGFGINLPMVYCFSQSIITVEMHLVVKLSFCTWKI